MSTIHVTNPEGETREISFTPGWTLMEVLREAGYDEILAMCGGCCSCATCHVHVSNAPERSLPPIEEDEEMLVMTTDTYDEDRSRLSCQIPMTEELAGLEVTILPED